MLLRLRDEPGLSVSALAGPLSLGLPGMMKHLDVLSDAGLISRTKTGRTVAVTLTPGPMREAMAWLERYERLDGEPRPARGAGRRRGGAMPASLPSVILVRQIKASPARVWAAITRADQMLRWWGPDAGPTLDVVADVRPGGRFSVMFRLLDGSEHNPTGVYREVVPETTLSFTWDLPGVQEPPSLVTFRLASVDGGTELTLTHAHLPDEAMRQSHEDGWNGLLDKLPPFLGVSA